MSFFGSLKSTKHTILQKARDNYNKSKQNRLKNKTPTIITRNCMAGIIYHDLGLQFNSPTINLSMDNEDFIVFLEFFGDFLKTEPVQLVQQQVTYPVGKFQLADKNIQINFVHYKTFEEAVDKWNQRVKRINFDNLYVIWEVANECGPDIELYNRFCNLPFQHKILITGKKFPVNSKNVIKLKMYNKKYYYGKILDYRRFPFFYKRYLDEFDYINFLNQF